MTNYEKYKESIDLILQKDTEEILAFNKNTEEVAVCQHLDCEDCLFYRNIGGCYCSKNTMRWLVSEYKKPKVDWRNIPIDTPVLVRHGDRWLKRHFAGVDDNGQPTAWNLGVTSWSEQNALRITCADMKLAEVEE